jgi:hypothetical protein
LAELSYGLGCALAVMAGWNMGRIRYSFMNPLWQQMTLSLAPALLPTLAVLIGILTNRYQLESLRNEMKTLEASVRSEMKTRDDSLRSEMKTRDDSLRSLIKSGDDSLRSEMKAGFEGQREMWRTELRRFEDVLDARLRHLEER